MYLVDTNIWLEILLEQKKSREAKLFFERIETENIHITEFSVYSIGIILSRYKKIDVLRNFIFDLIYESSVDVIRLKDNDHFKIIEAMEKYSLDFDDAYQYVAAKKMNLTMISFDSDFNKTPEKRVLPGQIIQ
jgi:predicted nucleic acid-binding protein